MTSSQVAQADIVGKSVRAVKWNSYGTAVRYVLQFGVQVLMARVLGPDNIGLFAMGLVILSFSQFFADAGFGWSLMQAREITEQDVRFAFTCQLISGTVVAVSMYLLAPIASVYFGDPRITGVVAWLSLAAFFGALSSPANNLLRRELDFRTLNIVQLTSYGIGYLVVGIPIAMLGGGVWSLVAAWITQSLCNLVLVVSSASTFGATSARIWGTKTIARTGGWVLVTNMCNWVLINLDRMCWAAF